VSAIETTDTDLRSGIWYCVKLFVGIRLALFAIGLVGVALLPDFAHVSDQLRNQIPLVPTPVSVPGWPAHALTPGWDNLFTAWERLDALWFLRIATIGYGGEHASAAFYPLYPLLIRVVSFLIGGHPFAASLLVSNGAFLGALMMLYVLTRSELTEETARRSVLYAATFPTALFFFAPYSESLFLLLVLVAFWGARRGRWEVAGTAAGLAALTRNLGVVLVLALAVEAIHQSLATRPWRMPIRSLLWSLPPVITTLAYLAFWKHLSGDWLAPIHQQAYWQRHLTDPVVTVAKGTHAAFAYLGVYPGGYHLLDWLIAVPVFVVAAYATPRLRPSYAVYLWSMILLPLASLFDARPLIAFSRYALPLFPVYWGLARLTEGRRAAHEALVVTSAALLGLMTLLFVNWYYII